MTEYRIEKNGLWYEIVWAGDDETIARFAYRDHAEEFLSLVSPENGRLLNVELSDCGDFYVNCDGERLWVASRLAQVLFAVLPDAANSCRFRIIRSK